MEDPLTDILLKPATDPVQILEVGVAKGQVVPPPLSPELWLVPLDSLQGAGVGMVMLAMLACTAGAMA